MTHGRTKLIIAGTILVAAITYLASASVKSGWVYFLDVDKFVADTQYHNQRGRLHGKVAEEGFTSNRGTLTAQFKLQGHTGKIDVAYRGAIPDQFAPARDVVVEGRMNDANVFQADVLMTKCASKYEPGSPHAGSEKRP
jgi:cytochrome c-type biogenesis protein CcmE